MSNVIQICHIKNYSLREANEQLPLIKKLTEAYANKISQANQDIGYLWKSGASAERVGQYRAKFENLIKEWACKINKLGTITTDFPCVRWDNGFGYYSWVLGEEAVDHYHGYLEHFNLRRKVTLLYDQKTEIPGQVLP